MDMTGGAGALLLLFFLVPPVLGALGIVAMFAARPRRHPFPACRGCGYDLTASADSGSRCPECGAAFAEVGIRPLREPSRLGPWMNGFILLLVCFAALVLFPLLLGGWL